MSSDTEKTEPQEEPSPPETAPLEGAETAPQEEAPSPEETASKTAEEAPSPTDSPSKEAPKRLSWQFVKSALLVLSWGLDLWVVGVVALAFGLSFGLNYGIENQTAYMLGSLKLLDPTVLTRDWYASGPAAYHPIFAYIGWFLLKFNRDGYWVGVAFVGTVVLGAMCIYWLALALFERRIALATYLLVMAILFITRTRSVAVSYIYDTNLQPSTLGSLFLLAALPPFASGRFLLSGVFLGLSGLFHANFLVLGIGAFGLAHVAMGMKDLPMRLLKQIGPPLVAFLILSPVIFASVGSKDTARARDILFNVRSPHHYSPKTYKTGFFPVMAWQLLGFGAGAWLLRGGDGRGRRFGALVLAFAAVVWGGTFFTTWYPHPFVAQMFVWRFAPFLDLLMAFLFCAAAASVATKPELFRRISPVGLALGFGGLASLAMLDRAYREKGDGPATGEVLVYTLVPAFCGLAVLGLGWMVEQVKVIPMQPVRRVVSKVGGWAVVLFAVWCCYRAGKPQAKPWRTKSNLIKGVVGAEQDMYVWIRTNTPKDALFLSPPLIERFRLIGERAIVVDWKGSAYAPSELVEWYERLEDVSGRKGFRTYKEVSDGYGTLDPARLAMLKAKYKIDYAVVGRGRETDLPGKVVYQNSRFAVIDLRG